MPVLCPLQTHEGIVELMVIHTSLNGLIIIYNRINYFFNKRKIYQFTVTIISLSKSNITVKQNCKFLKPQILFQ